MLFSISAKRATSHFLFPATILFACGIWWSAQTNILAAPAAVAFLTVAFFSFAQKKNIQKIIVLLPLIFIFLAGSTLYNFQQKKHFVAQENLCGSFCNIKGKIRSLEKSKQAFSQNVITINLYEIKKNGQCWKKTKATVALYTKKIDDLFVADTVEIRNVFFKKPKNKSFNSYLIKNGIAATAFIPEPNYTVAHRPWFSFSRWLSEQKQRVYKKLKQKISPKSFSFFSSIFLGNRNIKRFSFEKAKTEFKNWGILHFLARSGLHLVIFILLWSFILTFIPISFALGQTLLIVLALVYYGMSWTSISFVRALSVFLLYKLMPLANMRTNSIYLLLLVCLLTLICNPIALLFLDFQLSFGLAGALACLPFVARRSREA